MRLWLSLDATDERIWYSHEKEAHRGFDPTGGNQCRLGAGEVDPARASFDPASVVGAAAIGSVPRGVLLRKISMDAIWTQTGAKSSESQRTGRTDNSP